VPNGTDKECEGFEVDIEDITDTQITYTWPGSPEYPNPFGPASSITNTTFADGHTGVRVKFSAAYAGGAWTARTTIGTMNHYGVHVNGTPGLQTYSWLCDVGGSAAGSTGILLPYGGTTQGNFYPMPSVPSVSPVIVATPSGEAVQATVVPAQQPVSAEAQLPTAVWVLKYEASSPNAVDVNQLLITDPEVQHAITNSQISSVAELFQPDPGNAGAEVEPPDLVSPGDAASVTVTQTYQYTGPVDPADNSFTCNETVGDPNNCSNFVGPLIARRMVSANLVNTTPRSALNVTVSPGATAAIVGGTVTSDDVGNPNPGTIDCGTSWLSVVDNGSVVHLTATPSVGFDFVSWTGACTGTSPTCSVNVNARKNVKATFKVQPKLAVSVINHGTVVSSPAGVSCTPAIGVTLVIGPCKTPFAKGTAVTLSAAKTASARLSG